MLRSIFGKAMWVGSTTAAVIGLAIALAIVFGVATMALAAVPGDPFKLGKVNSINRISVLVGTATSPMLRVYNKGTGTALQLIVKDKSKPPMIVNSTAKVPRLNADRLDGKHAGAFLPKGGKAADSDKLDGKDATEIGVNGLEIVEASSAYNTLGLKTAVAQCPPGKKVVGGGARYSTSQLLFSRGGGDEIAIQASWPVLSSDRWHVEADWMGGTYSPPFNWRLIAYAVCAKAP